MKAKSIVAGIDSNAASQNNFNPKSTEYSKQALILSEKRSSLSSRLPSAKEMCFICNFILSGARTKSETGKVITAAIPCINCGFFAGRSTVDAVHREKTAVRIIDSANVGKMTSELPSNASLAESFILAFISITKIKNREAVSLPIYYLLF